MQPVSAWSSVSSFSYSVTNTSNLRSLNSKGWLHALQYRWLAPKIRQLVFPSDLEDLSTNSLEISLLMLFSIVRNKSRSCVFRRSKAVFFYPCCQVSSGALTIIRKFNLKAIKTFQKSLQADQANCRHLTSCIT